MNIHLKLNSKSILGCLVMCLGVSLTQTALAQRQPAGARPQAGGRQPQSGGAQPQLGGAQPQLGGGGAMRPTPNVGARPSLGGVAKPSGGPPSGGGGLSSGGLPGGGGNSLRPAQPTRPDSGSMPSLGGTGRPQVPNLQSPGGSRPTTGVQRPTTNVPRPVNPDLGSRPSLQVPGSMRPTTRPSLPDSGLDRPTRPTTRPTLPDSGLDRPTRPTTRPTLPDSGPDRPTRPTTRPTLPDSGLDRPTRPTTRPSVPDSGFGRPTRPIPSERPVFPERPSIGNRPVNPTQPHLPDRPGYPGRPIVIGDRPSRPNFGDGNLIIGGGNTGISINNNINNNNINNNINNWYGNSNSGWGNQSGWNQGWGNQSGWNQGWGWNSGWNQPSWYNGHWNSHWGTSWYRPAPVFYGGWGLSSWSSHTTFVNPYYVPSTTTIYNYSQPIGVSSIARSIREVDSPASEPDADTVALELFDEGVAAFKNGDFLTAMNKFDTAVHRLSDDPVLHEMRALTYFALGKFQESAAVLNSLLATAAGMDWTTMSGLYGDVELYTQQLRKLESHVESKPKDAAALFVLAYHYLVTGNQQDTAELLADVVKLQPNDTTAVQMLRALTADEADATPPSPPASQPPGAPSAEAASDPTDSGESQTDLVGTWIAATDDVTITLEVTEASTFTWRAVPKPIDDKPVAEAAELSGDVLASGETLVLNTEAQGAMTGRVQSAGEDQFRFIVPGGPPDNPGLTFDRQK